jgi:hypothetical protein
MRRSQCKMVLSCGTMEAVNGARDHLRYLGPSYAGCPSRQLLKIEVGLGDIWERTDEYRGYAY